MEGQTAQTRRSRNHDEYYDDEIDLMQYVLVLWRHGWVVVASTVVCGVVAFGVSRLSSPTYEATARLMISQSKMVDTPGARPISMATFRSLVENQSLAAQIVKEFDLGAPPHEVTPATFLSGALTVEVPRDADVITVEVRLWDRELAARVANRVVELAVALAERLSQEETVTARDIIKSQLDDAKKQFDDAEERLESFRKEAQVELLRKDVDAMLEQRGGLLRLLVEIQAEKARLAQAEAQLGQRERVDTLRRSIDTDPAAMEAARRGAGDAGSVLPLELRNEFINPVYESVDQAIATSRTRLAGLEKQKTELVDLRKLDAAQLGRLTLLYTRETELARVQTEHELAERAYVETATKYQQAQLQVAGRSAQLQILDRALPPDRPVAPRPLRTAAIAVLAGFFLSVVGVLMYDAASSAAARQHATAAQAAARDPQT